MKVKNPEEGGVVQSVQGRDLGKYYVITEVLTGGFVLVADGKTRTLERPKKKNLKHLRLTPRNLFKEGIVRDKSFDNRVAHYLKGLTTES